MIISRDVVSFLKFRIFRDYECPLEIIFFMTWHSYECKHSYEGMHCSIDMGHIYALLVCYISHNDSFFIISHVI